MALTRPQYQPVAKDHVDEIPLMETGNQPGDEAYDSDLEINTSEILDTEVKQDNISRRTLIRVLAANGVIQIPIWGKSNYQL
jgi:hypothetical protein